MRFGGDGNRRCFINFAALARAAAYGPALSFTRSQAGRSSTSRARCVWQCAQYRHFRTGQHT